MTKEEFYLLNNLYNASCGRAGITSDVFLNHIEKNDKIYRRLCAAGLLEKDSFMLTSSGIQAMAPYKVDNAVILAAGSATRFVPLSLEQPKGLYEVKGEKLIERLIKQLIDSGIRDITIVLGYKKEMFLYLKEKYPVKFIINPLYNVKNNIESLYCAREELKNTYICPCDSYFIENPFNEYEYQSFYAGFFTEKAENEMYAILDHDNRILDMQKKVESGAMLLGHTFWCQSFSDAFIRYAEQDQKIGKYADLFWEWLVKDKLSDLPPYYYKEYTSGMIHEFDYFEQLREFDTDYVGYTRSEIIRNIKLVFRCDEEDIIDFRNVSEGMTNTSFIFRIGDTDYIYRHPGEGTERIINRKNEKRSLILAEKYGIDPTYIYMDINEGWKISRFIHNFREPDYNSFEDSKRIVSVLKKLHSLPITVDYGMDPIKDAGSMERLLKEKNTDCFRNYEGLKAQIIRLAALTKGDGIEKCFCHGDTYKPNWMLRSDGEVVLIDWEYSGYSDPGIDVGYYIVDAKYDISEAKKFITAYLAEDCTPVNEFHYLAYTAIIAYYWFVWAMYRESCGADMGEALEDWRMAAEKYASYLLES